MPFLETLTFMHLGKISDRFDRPLTKSNLALLKNAAPNLVAIYCRERTFDNKNRQKITGRIEA